MHGEVMGQAVPHVKDDVSPASLFIYRHSARMTDWPTQADFEAALRERVRALRIARGWNQLEMARAIQVEHETYKKYETRSAMPAYLIPRFAQMVGRDVAYILTGKSLAPPPRQSAEPAQFMDTFAERRAMSRASAGKRLEKKIS